MTPPTWAEVEAAALLLPRARAGAIGDDPTVTVGPHPFVRRRRFDDREAVQLWCWVELAPGYAAQPATWFRVDAFSVKASVWAWLDRLDPAAVGELLAASHAARSGRRSA